MNEHIRRTTNTSNVGMHRRRRGWRLTKRGEYVVALLFMMLLFVALAIVGAVEAGVLD